jgi:hypothetical protein
MGLGQYGSKQTNSKGLPVGKKKSGYSLPANDKSKPSEVKKEVGNSRGSAANAGQTAGAAIKEMFNMTTNAAALLAASNRNIFLKPKARSISGT